MAHSEVYTKFLIEYDKAITTSSYPSLTKYEQASLLDKAYLALIAQKVTGNNQRQSTFESDTKAIEDIRPLLKTVTQDITQWKADIPNHVSNVYGCKLPEDMLYYVGATTYMYPVNAVPGRDQETKRVLVVTLVDHATAQNFFATANNMPWVKNPVCYIEGNILYVVYDAYTIGYKKSIPRDVNITYVIKPKSFVDALKQNEDPSIEINDSMVEELINLAIVMGAEIVESPRLTTKAQTRALEA